MQEKQPNTTDLRSRIVSVAADLFPRYGIKSVSMDDIARQVAISKRTLYAHFADKEELLIACIDHNAATLHQWADEIASSTETALHVALELFKKMIPLVKNHSPKFHEDLRRYPRARARLEAERDNRIHRNELFFHRGASQGVFLDNVVNFGVMTRTLEAVFEFCTSPEMTDQFTLTAIHGTMFYLFLRSVCTTKGLQIFDEFIADNQITLN